MRILFFIIAFTLSLSQSFGQSADKPLRITHLTGDFYIYTTYNEYQGGKVPANGLYLVTDAGVVLFDTPWDTLQFQPLLDSIQLKHGKKVLMCISTHFHEDRTAGLSYYRQQGIRTYTTALTDAYSQKNNKQRAAFLMAKDTVFKVGQYAFETFYPGEGHAPDNIVIWFGKQRILYGACLIKSWEDEDLGYLGDANKQQYAATIRNVQKKCTRPNYVIVGHGDWSKVQSLQHTLNMAEALRKQPDK